jgi:hypothetical protein
LESKGVDILQLVFFFLLVSSKSEF